MARAYNQVQRAEAAAETRRKILDAVYERLREAPGERVSLDRVARDAAVARSTIYLAFGSRTGLFRALRRDLVERVGYDRLIEVTRDPDPRVTLREGFRRTVEMYAAERDVFRALESMAQLDPDAVAGSAAEERTAGMAGLAMRLKKKGYLRDGVSARRAADLLFLLTSFDAFDLLYSGRGLGADAVAELQIETAERSLLDPRSVLS
jgi:AcrR family transcriptional regulator